MKKFTFEVTIKGEIVAPDLEIARDILVDNFGEGDYPGFEVTKTDISL